MTHSNENNIPLEDILKQETPSTAQNGCMTLPVSSLSESVVEISDGEYRVQ